MDKTKTVNASNISTNVHALNEPSNDSGNLHAPTEPSNDIGNLNTEDRQASTSGVTYFRPIRKANWKRTDDGDTDSDSSHAPTDVLVSDHSSDHIVSDEDACVTNEGSLEISIPDISIPDTNDLIYDM